MKCGEWGVSHKNMNIYQKNLTPVLPVDKEGGKKTRYWECIRSSKIHVSSTKILGNTPEVKQVFHKKKCQKRLD